MDLEIINIIDDDIGWLRWNNRIIKYTPAVTKVDEWTSAEIGVGAAIAIGNQAENGNWALFEHAAKDNMINVRIENSLFMLKFQFDDIIIILIDSRIRISPIRFLNSVMVPDAEDEKFW